MAATSSAILASRFRSSSPCLLTMAAMSSAILASRFLPSSSFSRKQLRSTSSSSIHLRRSAAIRASADSSAAFRSAS
uniref:Putative secreted protein n=1 Tax=Ixodes ricinus TaxID=34613 RepID=A0A6B0U024_IXORI